MKHEIPNYTQTEDSENVSTETYGDVRTKLKIHIEIPEETARKIESMMTKRDGSWTCRECDFKSINKSHLKEHAEKHIEGLQYPCSYCGKILRSCTAILD